MPFKKRKGGGYVSPSGRRFTKKQVALYYANGGKFPKGPKGRSHKKKGRKRKRRRKRR
jgi:hypothetical protein